MSKREFIFRAGTKEIILPVTPQSYQIEKGKNIEVVNIHEVGDITLAGYGTLATIKIDCMFPANDYPFGSSSDAEENIAAFKKLAGSTQKIRFIISDTGINLSVYLQSFQYGEKDGSNDIYATLTLRECKALQAVTTAVSPQANTPRVTVPVSTHPSSVVPYLVKYGDTLCSICRTYYGNDKPDTYKRLAKYNNMPNPNILYAGKTISIPRPLP